jgi:hypothetical protein
MDGGQSVEPLQTDKQIWMYVCVRIHTLNFTEINILYLSLNTGTWLDSAWQNNLYTDALYVRLVILLQAGSTKLVRCPYLPLLLATTDHTPTPHPTLPNRNGIETEECLLSLVFSPSVNHIPRYLKTSITLPPPPGGKSARLWSWPLTSI